MEGEKDPNLGLQELSRESVIMIRNEFKKHKEDIDYEKLTRVRGVLPFFAKFVEEV